ncbi:MAG: hypothetical protein HY719_15140, partial [Planctomycetes bacterium]|nr:hypothetical protein [Planctomycetota bacterium]
MNVAGEDLLSPGLVSSEPVENLFRRFSRSGSQVDEGEGAGEIYQIWRDAVSRLDTQVYQPFLAWNGKDLPAHYDAIQSRFWDESREFSLRLEAKEKAGSKRGRRPPVRPGSFLASPPALFRRSEKIRCSLEREMRPLCERLISVAGDRRSFPGFTPLVFIASNEVNFLSILLYHLVKSPERLALARGPACRYAADSAEDSVRYACARIEDLIGAIEMRRRVAEITKGTATEEQARKAAFSWGRIYDRVCADEARLELARKKEPARAKTWDLRDVALTSVIRELLASGQDALRLWPAEKKIDDRARLAACVAHCRQWIGLDPDFTETKEF